MSTSLRHDVGTSPDNSSGAAAAVTDIFSLLTHLSLPATTDSDSCNTTKLSELPELLQAIGQRRSVTRCSAETVARSLGCASECFGDDLPTVNVLVTISQQRKEARDDFAHSVFMNHLRSSEDVVNRMHEVPEHTPTEASKGEVTGTTLQVQLVQIGVTGVNLLHDVRLADGSPAALHILWVKVSRQARALASTSLVALATVVLRTGLRLAAPQQACHLRLWLDLGALRSASTRSLLKALEYAAALSLIEVRTVVSEGSLEVIRIRNERNNVMSLTQLGIGKLPKAQPWAPKSGEVVVDTPFQGQGIKEGVQEVLTQPLHTATPTDDKMEPFEHSTRDNALAGRGASASTVLLTPSSNCMEPSRPTPGDQLAQATASLSLHHRFQVLTPELLRELPIAANLDETGGYSSDELVEHLAAKAVEETGEPPLAELLFGAVHAPPTLTSPAASVGHSVRSYSLPCHMSCLLIEVGGPYCRSGVALRALLVQWWALSEEPWLLEQERVGNTHVLPPPHRRHVVLVADSYRSLQGALLSWTEEAHAEHALLLPLTGVCVADLDRSTYHVATPLQRTPRPEKFSMILHHLGRTLAVDPARSFGLCWSEDMKAGLAELGLPPAHFVSSIADCQAALSTWQGATSVFSSTTVPDICARRVALEAHLGSWWGLIRELVARPRRPAVAFQLVSTATKKRHCQRDVAMLRSVAAGEALCYGVAMPAVTSSTSCASVLRRARRYRAAQSPVLAMPTPEVRAGLYRFLEEFFTPPVFAAAVDVVRACQEGTFFSHYGCAAQGYLRHDVSCAVGNYIQVRLTVDLQPLISRVLQGIEADWQQVLPHMSCSCTPRSFERVPRTDAGVKKCRHLAEVLYLFMLRQLRFPEEATENRQSSSSTRSTPPPPSLVVRQRKGLGETMTPSPVAAAGTDRQPFPGCALMFAQESTTEAPQRTGPVKSPKVMSEKSSEEQRTSLETVHYHRHGSRRKRRQYSHDGNRASCRRLSEDTESSDTTRAIGRAKEGRKAVGGRHTARSAQNGTT